MRFKRVYLEISNLCNLRCPFCIPLSRPTGRMSAQRFREAAEQIRPFSDYLYLHVKGEPLCHPELPEILSICHELGFQVNVTTNGTLLRERGEALLSCPAVRQVNLSIHSFSQLPAQEGERCLEEAIAFGKRALEQGRPYVVYRMWNLGEGRRIDPASLALLRRIGREFPTAHDLEAELAFKKSAAIAKGVFLSWEEEFVWPSLKNPYVSDTGRCYGGRQMLGVLWDGTVVPCCLDSNGEAPLGNLFETPFSQIVASPVLEEMVRGFDGGRVTQELCRRCSYRTRFDRADAQKRQKP